VVAALAVATDARAVDHEHELGVDVGTSILTIADKETPDVGAGFGLHYGYGITDMFNLTVEVHYSVLALGVYPTDPPTHPSTMWNGNVGLQYVVDVMRWIPYLGASAGGYWMQGGTVGSFFLPGAEISVGLDYLVTRRWAVGFEGSEHFLFTDMSLYTSYTTAVARTMFLWGK
jgi:Outer membrane protein beta-barrel domain